MKKLIAMMTIVLVAALGLNVSAAETKSVWVDTREASVKENVLSVSVQSNGEVTDGVLELKYNSKVLSIQEEDVAFGEQVAMYSVNVTDDTVKMSYLSEKAMEQGAFVTLNFDVKAGASEKEAKDALKALTGSNYKEDGTGVPETEVGLIQNAGDMNQGGSANNGQDNSSNGSKSGDDTNLILPILLAVVAAAGIGGVVYYKKKGKVNHEN